MTRRWLDGIPCRPQRENLFQAEADNSRYEQVAALREMRSNVPCRTRLRTVRGRTLLSIALLERDAPLQTRQEHTVGVQAAPEYAA